MALGNEEPEEDRRGPAESAVDVVRRILVGLIRAVEDGGELIGASIREELARFRSEIERRVTGLVLLVVGGGLVTAGAAIFLERLFGSWAPVLLVLGALYVAVGAWLLSSSGSAGGDTP